MRCRVLVAPPGRAGQMNVGAAVASGPVLLFLHADTRLPERFEEPVRATLDRAGVVAGAFRLAIENARGPLRFIQWAANFRSRWLGMPYGDQAVFAKAEVFRAVGGFPDLPILEDLEMIRRFRRFGRIAVVAATVTTSSRRWASRGALRGSWINQMVLAGYFAGVSPDRLLRWYGRMGGRSQRAGDRGDDESRTSPGSSSRSGVGALSSAGPCGGRGGGRATSEALGSGLLPPDSAGPSMAGPVG
ncbi:MAG: TIGR04283 family arsenosugar biosynthesis glycosyltransferase [Candidatus Riflebacteria bacterium]|nr:TIGR04283 family arsenosugar biosynthesis glycosyltransferase [Candidatus Riflebacteria bacterium]